MNPQSHQSSSIPLPAVQPAATTPYVPPAPNQQASAPSHPNTATNPTSQPIETITAKAKQLMEQPNANPYYQNQALQALKAQYIAERYHITIKVTQD